MPEAAGRQRKKLQTTADCSQCGHPHEDTGHVLQCPHPDTQLLWDMAILQLCTHLHDKETEPNMIEDLSAGIDAWRKQESEPLALTPAGQAQASLNWQNLVPSFLANEWKIQQANYYSHQCNPALATTWAMDLLQLILKYVPQQWDHLTTPTTTWQGKRPCIGYQSTSTIQSR